MKISLRKKISRLLPEIVQPENKILKGKNFNNYRLNIITNKIKNNNSIGYPSIIIDNNYNIEKLKISPKRNLGLYTEKTEYSSQINDCLSKINGNSEIKPFFNNIKFNDSSFPKYRTETRKFYDSSKNIFDNDRINIFPENNNYRNFQTSSCWYKKTDDFKCLNKFDMENIIKFSNILADSKTQKVKKRRINHLTISPKIKNINNRFNSLNCFIDNYLQVDEEKLLNRYNPKYEEYLSKKDYIKLLKKGKTLLTAKEKIKLIFKDTKLIMAMCDYLNSSFSRLKNEKRTKLKMINKEIEEDKTNKKYVKSLENSIRNNFIPKKDLFKLDKKFNKVFIKKVPLIYKNGYFSKTFYFPTSLSYNKMDLNKNKKEYDIKKNIKNSNKI